MTQHGGRHVILANELVLEAARVLPLVARAVAGASRQLDTLASALFDGPGLGLRSLLVFVARPGRIEAAHEALLVVLRAAALLGAEHREATRLGSRTSCSLQANLESKSFQLLHVGLTTCQVKVGGWIAASVQFTSPSRTGPVTFVRVADGVRLERIFHLLILLVDARNAVAAANPARVTLRFAVNLVLLWEALRIQSFQVLRLEVLVLDRDRLHADVRSAIGHKVSV